MTHTNEASSTFGLLRDLGDGVLGLFRKEIELAKAEASEKVDQTIGAVELLLGAAVLMIGALGVLLAALVSGLAAFFVAQGMTEQGASALSAGIVGVLLTIAAWLMLSRGLANLKAKNLALPETRRSLGRDADLVKEKI